VERRDLELAVGMTGGIEIGRGVTMEYVQIERRDGVGHLTLMRPEVHNACNRDMLREIADTVRGFDADPEIVVVVVTGAGKSFCSGSDVRELRSLTDMEAQARARQDYTVKETIATCTKPVLAAIQGYCLGGGLELASACDLRIASEDAVFGLPEIKLGALAGSGGLQRLPALIGLGRTKDWALTGRHVTAEQALAAGLLMEVCPRDRLEARTREIALELAAQSPLAMRVMKAALDHGTSGEFTRSATLHELASGAVRRNKEFR
jgi:enoyl-CoA hydratase/carnithine racemase